MSWIAGIVLVVLILLAVVILVRTFLFKPEDIAPANPEDIWLNEEKIVTDMADMIRCKTVSYRDEALIDRA